MFLDSNPSLIPKSVKTTKGLGVLAPLPSICGVSPWNSDTRVKPSAVCEKDFYLISVAFIFLSSCAGFHKAGQWSSAATVQLSSLYYYSGFPHIPSYTSEDAVLWGTLKAKGHIYAKYSMMCAPAFKCHPLQRRTQVKTQNEAAEGRFIHSAFQQTSSPQAVLIRSDDGVSWARPASFNNLCRFLTLA